MWFCWTFGDFLVEASIQRSSWQWHFAGTATSTNQHPTHTVYVFTLHIFIYTHIYIHLYQDELSNHTPLLQHLPNTLRVIKRYNTQIWSSQRLPALKDSVTIPTHSSKPHPTKPVHQLRLVNLQGTNISHPGEKEKSRLNSAKREKGYVSFLGGYL